VIPIGAACREAASLPSREPLRSWWERAMRREYHLYVYTMQSASRRGLYIDMTNHLHRHVGQRKTQVFEGFTDDYHDARLVYWQSVDAINREKQLKNWRRVKHLRLIATMDPRWQDLAADWYETATIVPKLT
jgi:putative endonuclease